VCYVNVVNPYVCERAICRVAIFNMYFVVSLMYSVDVLCVEDVI